MNYNSDIKLPLPSYSHPSLKLVHLTCTTDVPRAPASKCQMVRVYYIVVNLQITRNAVFCNLWQCIKLPVMLHNNQVMVTICWIKGILLDPLLLHVCVPSVLIAWIKLWNRNRWMGLIYHPQSIMFCKWVTSTTELSFYLCPSITWFANRFHRKQ